MNKLIFIALLFLSMSTTVKAQTWASLKAITDSLNLNASDYVAAYESALKAEKQANLEFGKRHINYVTTVLQKGSILTNMGRYVMADSVISSIMDLTKEVAGPISDAMAEAYHSLGILRRYQNKFDHAIKYTTNAKEIWGKVFGLESDIYAEAVGSIGTVYLIKGDYEKAEPYLIESVRLLEKLQGRSSTACLRALSNLGNLYNLKQEYDRAEPLLSEVLSIRAKIFGPNHPSYGNSLGSLSPVYQNLGDFDNAIRLNRELLRLREKTAKNSPDHALALQNLAGTYYSIRRFAYADSLFREAMNIMEKASGKENLDYANLLNNYGLVQARLNHPVSAQKALKEAYLIANRKVGQNNILIRSILQNLALAYRQTGDDDRVDSLIQESKKVITKMIGRTSVGYAGILTAEVWGYQVRHKYSQAVPLIREVEQIVRNNLERNFLYMSPAQKQSVIGRWLPLLQRGLSVVSLASKENGLPEIAYQSVLFQKNLLLVENTKFLSALKKINSLDIKLLYDSLTTLRTTLGRQLSKPIAQQRNIDSLETEAETLEKKLASQSAMFRRAQQSLQIKWEDVRNALKPTEAAVEFISFPYHDGRQQTDTIRYMAVVLRPGDKAPQIVPLLTDETPLRRLLTSLKVAQSINSLYAKRGSEIDSDQLTRGDSLYQLIWQPLDHLLSSVKTVYFSPSGLLHQLSFAALPYTVRHKKGIRYLADRYKLWQVGSTRQIATPTHEADRYQNLSSFRLYGGIQYDSITVSQVANATKRLAVGALSTPKQSANTWPYLVGSQKEVERIGQLVGPRATVVTGSAATETAIKALSGQSPSVLHIATHGFSFPDPIVSPADSSVTELGGSMFRRVANPLLRTGLLMAGVNAAWRGVRPGIGQEDGILTAYEVANLNLSATNVVVLSACETALGDIRGSEGVFGLQRAFKMAGARYLLMSLWPVSDQHTSELMTEFYRKWKKYKIIREAFQQTQLAMRKKYSPSVWAAFVLIE